jgi:hypothetical protein
LQEALLNQLQNRVEKEEGRWRQQLQIKEAELETVREENNQLQQSLEQLQGTEEVRIKWTCLIQFQIYLLFLLIVFSGLWNNILRCG